MRATPIRHFKKQDPRNVMAANERVAELKIAEGNWNTRSTADLVTTFGELTNGEWPPPPAGELKEAPLAQPIISKDDWAPLSRVVTEIISLRVGGCRFPEGQLDHENFRFCNAQRRIGSSYCELHTAICRADINRRRKAE